MLFVIVIYLVGMASSQLQMMLRIGFNLHTKELVATVSGLLPWSVCASKIVSALGHISSLPR